VGRQNLSDAPVSALDPAVGLRPMGVDQAVLHVMLCAQPIEAMPALGVTLAGGAVAMIAANW
jgi:hypothetical protein